MPTWHAATTKSARETLDAAATLDHTLDPIDIPNHTTSIDNEVPRPRSQSGNSRRYRDQ